ncbi:Pyridoxal-dependent decarboxylase, pyridoxal binding domain [Jannaschia pohangensis]|uniref:ornithine decarboxylase n=1 Tax=Jannaschia pohangensis TaxID=390807 RepID=A0A1I3QX67_9RHOB|nr:Pyridoxal-dependent decarboxylase, pyridoxal binding domain [Jannaschia pohangensis]
MRPRHGETHSYIATITSPLKVSGLRRAHIHYAVKANPHPAIIERLVAFGSGFDSASRGEIELVLDQGADVDHVSLGDVPQIMVGPSCDSADVLSEKRPIGLPLSLRAGKRSSSATAVPIPRPIRRLA